MSEVAELHGDRVYVADMRAIDAEIAEWAYAFGRRPCTLDRSAVWNLAAQCWIVLTTHGLVTLNYEPGNGKAYQVVLTRIPPVARDLHDADVVVSLPALRWSYQFKMGQEITPDNLWGHIGNETSWIIAEFLTTLATLPRVYLDAAPLDPG